MYDPSPLLGQIEKTPEEIFNYRLSRARITVECAFGRLTSRFRIFHRPIETSIKTTDKIIRTTCVLHNYLAEMREPSVAELAATELPPTMCPLTVNETESTTGNAVYKKYLRIRQNVNKYLLAEGNVSFQWSKIASSLANSCKK